jgi:hypothetical protein
MKSITTLASNEVFVFGSNNSGFHGAGAAGFAFSGTPANDWRACPKKQSAIKALPGHPDRIGFWAVWGVAEGFQVGTSGRSYAIRTVVRPGGPVVPMAEIEAQFLQLWSLAELHPELTFLLTEVGGGLAGHRRGDLRAMVDRVINHQGLPRNIQNSAEVYS